MRGYFCLCAGIYIHINVRHVCVCMCMHTHVYVNIYVYIISYSIFTWPNGLDLSPCRKLGLLDTLHQTLGFSHVLLVCHLSLSWGGRFTNWFRSGFSSIKTSSTPIMYPISGTWRYTQSSSAPRGTQTSKHPRWHCQPLSPCQGPWHMVPGVSDWELTQSLREAGDARELVFLKEPPRRRDRQRPVNTCASLLSDASALGGCSHPEPTPHTWGHNSPFKGFPLLSTSRQWPPGSPPKSRVGILVSGFSFLGAGRTLRQHPCPTPQGAEHTCCPEQGKATRNSTSQGRGVRWGWVGGRQFLPDGVPIALMRLVNWVHQSLWLQEGVPEHRGGRTHKGKAWGRLQTWGTMGSSGASFVSSVPWGYGSE